MQWRHSNSFNRTLRSPHCTDHSRWLAPSSMVPPLFVSQNSVTACIVHGPRNYHRCCTIFQQSRALPSIRLTDGLIYCDPTGLEHPRPGLFGTRLLCYGPLMCRLRHCPPLLETPKEHVCPHPGRHSLSNYSLLEWSRKRHICLPPCSV